MVYSVGAVGYYAVQFTFPPSVEAAQYLFPNYVPLYVYSESEHFHGSKTRISYKGPIQLSGGPHFV